MDYILLFLGIYLYMSAVTGIGIDFSLNEKPKTSRDILLVSFLWWITIPALLIKKLTDD